MRIFFIGTVKFSKSALEKLVAIGANVVGVATKSASKFNADYAELAPICIENQIEVQNIKDINAPESIAWIKTLKSDVIFCFGWSNLIKKELLDLTPLGVVGYHPTELPLNRGRHPIIWALVLGLTETASTFFFMKEGADDGDILSQRSVSIAKEDDAKSLYEKLTSVALDQIETFHQELKSNTYSRQEQNHSKSNLWRKRSKNDGRIDFRMTSEAIYNLVRGLTKPYIGAHIETEEGDIKVWKVEIGDRHAPNIEPGKVLQINSDNVQVKTGDGTLWLRDHEFEELPKINDYL